MSVFYFPSDFENSPGCELSGYDNACQGETAQSLAILLHLVYFSALNMVRAKKVRSEGLIRRDSDEREKRTQTVR